MATTNENDGLLSEIQELQDLLKSAKEETETSLSKLRKDIAETQHELEEADKDPKLKAAFEHALATLPIGDLIPDE